VEAHDVEIGFGESSGGDRPGALTPGRGIRVESLKLEAGSLTLVSGPTGSGKTTLLRAIAGLHTHTDGGWTTGVLRVVGHERATVPPRDLAQRVGVVLQHPREAFATERVRDEIGLALELRGVAPVIVAARVAEVAGRTGVTALLDRPTRGLSAGEATLVAIAAAIVEQPILLLVDEPLADLDADARGRITRLLDGLAHEAGMCVVVAEHRVEALAGVADGVLQIADDVVEPVTRAESPEYAHAVARQDRRVPGEPVLRARDLTVRHGGALAVSSADLDLRAGEVVALIGPNGAGKSSLLAALALPARGADVRAPGRVALVPDASDDLFVSDSVAAECRRADRRAEKGRAAVRFAGFLGLEPDSPEFEGRLARHPRDLSAGERRCLAIALQLASAPCVLLVDEPTRGLDPAAREQVWAALESLAAAGTAVLVATHESGFITRTDRAVTMSAGVLTSSPADAAAAPTPAAVLAGSAAERVAGDPRVGRYPVRSSETGGATHAQSGANGTPGSAPAPRTVTHRRPRRGGAAPAALGVANLVALGAFCWPLVATAVPEQAYAAVPVAALALVPLAALVVVATLDGSVRSAHMLALLGTLAGIGAAVRIAGTGVGGVEAVFILLILAGRAYGARFGMLLGIATIALSTLITGTFGPWTPFQMFACAWVGAIAGLLPRRSPRAIPGARARPRHGEIAMLSVYGVGASYAFGLLMNLWFWPFAVGYGTGISYDGSAPLDVNLSSFLVYSLVTSTLSWDTLRAITTVIGLVVVGRPILAALRRTKPLTSRTPAPALPRLVRPKPAPAPEDFGGAHRFQ
jgi:energy-coupling factor transport system ATP-binding protein